MNAAEEPPSITKNNSSGLTNINKKNWNNLKHINCLYGKFRSFISPFGWMQ